MIGIGQLLSDWRTVVSSYRKPLFIMIGLLLSAFAIDFWSRILVLRDSVQKPFVSPVISGVSSPTGIDSIRKTLEQWIPARVEVVAPTEREIVLQGIFGTGSEARAALALLSAVGGPPERARVTVGQVVDGWTVFSIGSGKVVLKKGETVKELVLFRPRAG